MSERRGANREHPMFPEYLAKCEQLHDAFLAKEKEILAKYPEWRGLDDPAEVEIHPIRKKFHGDLKNLQEEYSLL